ncbi:RB1-inducible coiled-coil protein 1 isoform X2 [Anopheles coustani]|uniref:RB1-inducible coiled-coil protein 1 isoform X2 n=1 Tax=Anopheles coustani TaxID=139045 RepID=UPI00265A1B04|nr:RB1-inducible coiled-coil protein 1 isoform X2 [Anopheles coustani]
MMYVFHVDQGRMLTFEMNWMFEDIRKLKEVIERNHAIPANSIVLLVSGGELLEDDTRVCKYATGTDTNPIYMFSTKLGDSPLPSPGPSKETEVDLEGLVKKSLELPVCYPTVVSRAQLAQKICEMGREELRRCEALVHEQHLQQQGWAAVVANMEDTVKEFQERCEDFSRFYEEQIRLHEEQMDILNNFDKNLQQLADIPILSTLMENTELRPYGMFDEPFNQNGNSSGHSTQRATTSGSSERPAMKVIEEGSGDAAETRPEERDSSASSSGGKPIQQQQPSAAAGDGQTAEGPSNTTDPSDVALTEVERAKGISLLDWISAAEGQLTLKRMAEECRIGMEKFSRQQLTALKERIQKAVKTSQSDDIRIVKGLEERLCGLDQLLAEAKKYVQEQTELAQSIQMNQTRANTLGDTSILPDLCSMHRNHLKLMKDNHTKMLDFRRRCQAAKIELGKHLTRRLDYIMGLETMVCDLDSHLLFCYTSLKRLQKHLSIIEQIHMAPCMYVSAVTEVVRRRLFSSSFLRWASDLACRLMTIHNEEVMRRQEFTSQFEGHFLSTLFPGMNDMPPSYAIQAPSVFDSSLPALDKQDLRELSRFLPELTEKIPLPNIASVIDFFQTRSVEQKQQTSSCNTGKEEGSASAPGQQCAKDSDKVGAESETDTEEFENVQNQTQGRSSDDGAAGPAAAVLMCSVATSTEPVETVSAETLTEDNLGTTRLEVERLKGLLSSVHQLSQDSIAMLRDQLSRVRAESEANRTQFQSDLCAMNRAWNDIQEVARNRERETIQRLTVDHELEMNDLRKSIHQKDDEIQSLRADNSTMKASQIETVSSYEQEKRELADQIEQMKAVIGRLERQLAESEVDRKRAIQEAVEQLEHKHRTEIETLRCRFKLMATSMDRSPSDTSLEKIERPDMIDTGTHEQVLAQLREEFAREKERAIRAAVEEERQRWEANATPGGGGNRLHRSFASAGSPGGSQDVYKRILEEKDRQLEEAREKEALLARENQRMKETIQSLTDPELSLNDLNYRDQLETLEGDRQQLAEQLATQQSHVERLQGEKKSLARELTKQRRDSAQLLTCSEGDTVTFVWNSTYAQYTIVQASEFHFFLHEGCYAELGLQPLVMGEVPTVLCGLGTVVHKEFCHARKNDNRYRVSRGTHFYRVKLKPINLHKKSKGGSGSTSGKTIPTIVENPSIPQPSPTVVTIEMQQSRGGGGATTTVGSTGTNTISRFLDSFAQTEQPATLVAPSRATMIGSPIDEGSKSPTGSTASRDMIDSGVVEQQRSSYRERNISITDEEDIAVPPVGIGSDGSIDRIRYQSVCEEEDDPAMDDTDGGGGGLTEDGGDGGGSSATLMLLKAFLLLNGDEE